MSGHSKWSKIKRQKGALDQRRGAEFSKLARAIKVAVRQGGSKDPDKNSSLRQVLAKAKAINMPKANIERAMNRGLKKNGGVGVEQFVLEGYGPSGVAVVVNLASDNRQRTTAEIRNLFERAGGNLSAPGSAAFMFERVGDNLRPKVDVPVTGEFSQKVQGLLEALQNHPDVTRVSHTAQMPK